MLFLNSQRGFSMLEVVIFLVIVGIMAGIGVPKYLNMKSQAEIAADKANKSAIEAVIMNRYIYQIQRGQDVVMQDVVDEFNSTPNIFFGTGQVPDVPQDRSKTYKARISNERIYVYY